jgi:transcriptional regulator of arginine metabolism
MNKDASGATPRREAILRLVREAPVRSQEDLLRGLKLRGFSVTQPTLSRDVRELGLAKTPAGYVAPGDLSALQSAPGVLGAPGTRDDRLHQALRDFVASVEIAGPIVVLRTPPAAAQPVARAIDDAAIEQIAGTIAGDDTVFVAARGSSAARAVAARFLSFVRPGRRLRRARA